MSYGNVIEKIKSGINMLNSPWFGFALILGLVEHVSFSK